ncbi:hypothetical protein BH10PAT3_BH10PAT3_0180 [soil metagenome]
MKDFRGKIVKVRQGAVSTTLRSSFTILTEKDHFRTGRQLKDEF